MLFSQRAPQWQNRLNSFGALHTFPNMPLTTPLVEMFIYIRDQMETGPFAYEFSGLDTVLQLATTPWTALPFHVLLPRDRGKPRKSTGNMHLEKAQPFTELTLRGLMTHRSMLGIGKMASPALDETTNTMSVWIGVCD